MNNKPFPSIGDKITFKGIRLFWYVNIIQDAHDLLEVGKEYTVAEIRPASSWCGVVLKEFPEKLFTLSFFDVAGPNEISLRSCKQYS